MSCRVLVRLALFTALSLLPHTPAVASPKPALAPSFALPTAHGVACLDSLRGRVVLVDFWASWCTPCRASFGWMSTMHQRYASKGLTIVAINLDKERGDADRFLAEVAAPFTVAFDPAGRTADAYRVQAMPTSVLVGPTGTILYRHLGFDSRKTAEFEHIIQEACGK